MILYVVSVLVNVVPPPPQISTAHNHLLQKLTDYVMEQSSCRIQHTDQPEVPAIVTIVNSSRVVADIRRDILRVKGMECVRETKKLNIFPPETRLSRTSCSSL